jgi:beta-ring hydroxylase
MHVQGKSIDMENYFSRLALDIIGKAVFNYDFDSLTHDDPVIQVRAWTAAIASAYSSSLVP